MKFTATLLLMFLLVTARAYTQQPNAEASKDVRERSDLVDKLKEKKDAEAEYRVDEESRSRAFPEVSELDRIMARLDDESQRQFLEAMAEYYTMVYRHRKDVFEWQLLSSKVTFVVVIVLVASGVYFSGVQFHSSLRRKRKGSEEDDDATEIEASIKGIKVSSPVLGVIILVISLLFFYLYLVHVYPIKEVTSVAPTIKEASNNGKRVSGSWMEVPGER